MNTDDPSFLWAARITEARTGHGASLEQVRALIPYLFLARAKPPVEWVEEEDPENAIFLIPIPAEWDAEIQENGRLERDIAIGDVCDGPLHIEIETP